MKKTPDQQTVFLPDCDVDALAEAMVALANADGGLIVLGLGADGKPAASIWEEEAEDAVRGAAERCRPQVASQWQRVERPDGGILIGIRVAKGQDLHTLRDGRILMRVGTENQPLDGRRLRDLANRRTVAEYEAEIVPGATLADFDREMVDEYLSKREARGGALTGTLESLLFEIGAINHQKKPTVNGILLFCRNPQAFLPQSGLVFVKFAGAMPRGEDGGAGYGRRDELTGPIARIVERAWNIVWEEMRVGARVRGLEREDLTEYPRFAVREAIVNAICHRDYRVKGRRIEIRMYSDRLEVISPGGLPGFMTLDNLVEEHYSRNPRLVNGLFQWGYIEELGLGIDRMIEEMVQAGHPPPDFKATPHLFTVRLHSAQERKVKPRWTRTMNERQTRALTHIRTSGSITNREYGRLVAGVSAETLRRDLADLVTRGVLLKIGSKKGTYYILK